MSCSPSPSASFDGRGLRNSDRSLPLRVAKKYMLPVWNSFLTPSGESWPVFIVRVGQPSPNDSSMKLATLPSQLNVAECQKSTFFWSYDHSGSSVSGRPERRSIFHTCACSPHAAPTMPFSGNELRSWQPRKLSSGATMPWSFTGR